MGENVLVNKSKAFAIRIVRLNSYLKHRFGEPVMPTQLLRCGTSVVPMCMKLKWP